MFTLTVVDHLRLDSNQIEQNYTVHARAAEHIVGLVFRYRVMIATLLATATGMTIGTLFTTARACQVAAVASTALALVAFALYVAQGLEGRLVAHRTCAHRLWLTAQRYRSLLTEVQDGLVDSSTLLQRRDELIRDAHRIYEGGFGADHDGHESLRLPALQDQLAA